MSERELRTGLLTSRAIWDVLPRMPSRLSDLPLDGVNVASLGLMVTVIWPLGRAALVDDVTSGLALVVAVLAFRLRLNSVWLVVGGAPLGLTFKLLG